ncbi:hypothetical protein EVAR_83441_1 [Eumeta japonica]|uniref:Uncharacterized protein n=1 Tax=Eumeta variegata TaxID=151549 RepID=A0A4C1TYX3_EUMVA|nr:hypothetical protein EVAR_83441_1 [Eumeta japonica]
MMDGEREVGFLYDCPYRECNVFRVHVYRNDHSIGERAGPTSTAVLCVAVRSQLSDHNELYACWYKSLIRVILSVGRLRCARPGLRYRPAFNPR